MDDCPCALCVLTAGRRGRGARGGDAGLERRQTEGQIDRPKTLKRQMHGRAGLDLLERRVLPAA
jgi:hypothetical protein